MEIETSDNFADAERMLRELPRRFATESFIAGLEAAAEVVAREAEVTVAFRDDTGRLRASIRVVYGAKIAGNRAQLSRRIDERYAPRVEVSDNKAHLIEFGHGGPRPAPPHPFLLPAALETEARQLREAAAAMRQHVRYLARAYRSRYPSLQRAAA